MTKINGQKTQCRSFNKFWKVILINFSLTLFLVKCNVNFQKCRYQLQLRQSDFGGGQDLSLFLSFGFLDYASINLSGDYDLCSSMSSSQYFKVLQNQILSVSQFLYGFLFEKKLLQTIFKRSFYIFNRQKFDRED